jgi:hypothetical protein
VLVPFEGQIGAVPRGFSPALTGDGEPVAWKIDEDASAVSGRILTERSSDPTEYRFPHCVWQGQDARDLLVSVRFKPIAGKVDQAGGLVLRWRDENNYYVARANALENNVRFYKVVAGRRRQLEGRDLEVKSGAWHQLAVRASGSKFEVVFNGATLYDVEDTALGGAGKAGVWTKSDSVTAFDELTLEAQPPA